MLVSHFLKEYKVCQIFIPTNLVNDAGLGTITIRNCELTTGSAFRRV